MPCRAFIIFTIVVIKLLYATEANAQFGGYYSTINGQSGSQLKSALNGIIDNHNSLSYTPGVWNAHKDLYEDPDNADNIILFYSQDSIDKSNQDSGGSPDTYWNREHLWPRSYGVGSSGSDNTDLHHLVPVYKSVNSTRSNKYFDYSNPSLPGYDNPADPLSPNCTANSDTFEPDDPQKGHVSRAILYMATRYDYLEIVNTPPSSPPSTSDSKMAQLSVLLDWNRKVLPTVKEKNNNQKIYESYQYNRNPFIDFPEFADAIWVDGPSWGKWRLDNFSLEELNASISADYADPDGDGITNLMERAIYSDPKTANGSPPIEIDVVNNNFVISFVRARNFENLNTDLILEKSTDFVNWNTIDLTSASTQIINDNQEIVQVNLASTNDEVTISVLNSMTLEPFTVSFSEISLYNYGLNTSSIAYRDLLFDVTERPTSWIIEMGALSKPATVSVELLPTPTDFSSGTFSVFNSIQTAIWDASVDVLGQSATFKQVAQVSGVTSGDTITGSIDTTRSDNYVDVAAMRITIDYNPGQLRYNIDFGNTVFDSDDNDSASGFGTNYYTWNTATGNTVSLNPFSAADPNFGDYASITTTVTAGGSFYRLRATNLSL